MAPGQMLPYEGIKFRVAFPDGAGSIAARLTSNQDYTPLVGTTRTRTPAPPPTRSATSTSSTSARAP